MCHVVIFLPQFHFFNWTFASHYVKNKNILKKTKKKPAKQQMMYNSETHSHALTWQTILPTHTPTYKTLPWLLTSSFRLKCSNLARMSPSLRLSCFFPPRRRARWNPIFFTAAECLSYFCTVFFTQLV